MATPGTICVDAHAAETGLYEALVSRFGDQLVTRRRLDVGDVELTADAGAMIIERKTWPDLAKSLSDGRYAEQKARILSLVGAAGVAGGDEDEEGDDRGEGPAPWRATAVYVVEGALTGWHGKVGGRMGGTSQVRNAQLEAAIVSTSVRDGVPVLRSKDAAHTVELVAYLFGKLQAGEWGGAGAPAAAGAAYAGLVKKRKRDNLTPATTWEVMLAQVQGMSANKAAAVAAAFPTMTALAAATKGALAGLLVPPAAGCSGKARRLGPAVAERLVALA